MRYASPRAPIAPRGPGAVAVSGGRPRGYYAGGRAYPRPHYSSAYHPRAYYGSGYYNRGYYNGGYYKGGHYKHGHYGYPYYGHVYYGAPYYGYQYAPYYARPYAFRPHLHIGFGVFVGYPFAYAHAYPAYVPTYVYPSYATGSIRTVQGAYGGITLEINPRDAEVFVNGTYVGTVDQFDGSQYPLSLEPGTHRVEIHRQGYEPLVLEVEVASGQVLPYRGDLRPVP